MPNEVEYGFTKNMGNFQSERLSLRLEVLPEEDAEETLSRCRQWVAQHLSVPDQELNDAHYKLADLEVRTKNKSLELERINTRYNRLREAFSVMGFELPEDPADLPF